MSIIMGTSPERLTVVLSRDAPFAASVKGTLSDGSDFTWPDGTTVELALGDDVWSGAISSSIVLFQATVDQVNAVLDSDAKEATLSIVQSGVRVPWARGKVVEPA